MIVTLTDPKPLWGAHPAALIANTLLLGYKALFAHDLYV